MQKRLESQLDQAIKEFEILINSENKELFMDILSEYVKNQRIDDTKAIQAVHELRNIKQQFA